MHVSDGGFVGQNLLDDSDQWIVGTIFPLLVSRSQIDRRLSTMMRHSPSSFDAPGLSALPLTHR
jgi:hypothetical protein